MHDRLCAQRFLEFGPLTQTVPDETTMPHFRHLLEQDQLAEPIFARVRAQLEQRGLLVKNWHGVGRENPRRALLANA